MSKVDLIITEKPVQDVAVYPGGVIYGEIIVDGEIRDINDPTIIITPAVKKNKSLFIVSYELGEKFILVDLEDNIGNLDDNELIRATPNILMFSEIVTELVKLYPGSIWKYASHTDVYIDLNILV